MPSLIGSEGGFQSSGNTQKLDVVDDMESQMSPFWDFLILALRALFFFYMFFSSVAGVDIHTSLLTNRKIIVSDEKMFRKVDKHFRERIAGSETLPSTHHFSYKVRSMLEEILSNMDKVIKQRPQSLNGIKWEIVASKVLGIAGLAYSNGKIIINLNSFNGLIQMESWPLLSDMRHELKADYIGMLLSASAGYDPREAHKYFVDEDWVASSRIPSFLRVHPPSEKRAEALLQEQLRNIYIYV